MALSPEDKKELKSKHAELKALAVDEWRQFNPLCLHLMAILAKDTSGDCRVPSEHLSNTMAECGSFIEYAGEDYRKHPTGPKREHLASNLRDGIRAVSGSIEGCWA